MNVIKYQKIFFIISGLLISASIFSFVFFGVKQGIDLAGGANWQIQIENPEVKDSDLKSALAAISEKPNLIVKSLTEKSFIIRLPSVSEEEHQKYYQTLKERFGEIEELSFESIGPTIGQELKQRFLRAFFLGLASIMLYVVWAFRKVSYPIKSWKYGSVGIFCLFHDILITAGFMVFLGWWRGVEIDTNFIVALLFILGYSINNTIVVFDRVRENLLLNRGGRFDFAATVNGSLGQTFGRSLNTSLTTILVLLALYFLGPLSLEYFILIIISGIIIGTYSSIFIASPLLYVWHRKK